MLKSCAEKTRLYPRLVASTKKTSLLEGNTLLMKYCHPINGFVLNHKKYMGFWWGGEGGLWHNRGFKRNSTVYDILENCE